MTVGELQEILKKIPAWFPVYLSASNASGDYASGEAILAAISRENDLILSNEDDLGDWVKVG